MFFAVLALTPGPEPTALQTRLPQYDLMDLMVRDENVHFEEGMVGVSDGSSPKEHQSHPAKHALAPEADAQPCVACSDEPSEYMKGEQISCATYVRTASAQARDKCSKHWAHDRLCQRSCYEAGWSSLRCCEDKAGAAGSSDAAVVLPERRALQPELPSSTRPPKLVLIVSTTRGASTSAAEAVASHPCAASFNELLVHAHVPTGSCARLYEPHRPNSQNSVARPSSPGPSFPSYPHRPFSRLAPSYPVLARCG
jgi:hypothetical protein